MRALIPLFLFFSACVMDRVDSRLNIENRSPYSAKIVFECKNIDCISCDSNKLYLDTIELNSLQSDKIRLGPHPMIFWEEYFENADTAFLKVHFYEDEKKDTLIVIRKDVLDSIRKNENWKIIVQ